jgi:hypothetical protein
MLRAILLEQGVDPAELVVLTRDVVDDAYVMDQLRARERADGAAAGCSSPRCSGGRIRVDVARWPCRPEPNQLGWLIGQTLLLYVVLVGGLAWLLRRITRRSPR